MTQTTTTAPARYIPATGLRHQAGTTTVVAFWVNAAGWKVQVSTDGRTTHSDLFQHEHVAVAEYNRLVAEHAPAETPAAPRLAPAAKGTATKVSDPQHTALAVAFYNGNVERGGHEGQASVKTLTALAKRGLLTLTYQQGRRDARKVVTGGTITGPGRRRLAELTQADRELAAYTARLEAALNTTSTATVAA